MSNLKNLADAFEALTYREMKELAEVMVEAIDAINGMKIKPQVMADALDSLNSYIEIELETKD